MPPAMDLALCHRCGDETVVPVGWEQNGRAHWWIRLRCGNCGSFRETIATDEQAHALDTVIHRRAQPIADAIAQLDRERMAREAQSLATALEHDLIDAQDFAGPRRPPPSCGFLER